MTDWPEGYDKVVLDTVDSTNQEARRRAETAARPTWIMARAQSQGRGRRGREWHTADGNLFATLLISRHVSAQVAARFSFHAALAVADTFRVLAPNASISVKWPNDVLLNQGKASGILLEALGEGPTGACVLAIGMGMNLASAPGVPDALVPPTSLAEITGRSHAPEEALAILARRFDHWLVTDAEHGFTAVREAWCTRAIGIGQPITVRLPTSTVSGVFIDVDADGLLVLETTDGVQTIAARDVFFPGSA
jgi:BirA family biotin operon repressor/biotin-[acetyl-CoA-carboxylase] ligase